MNKLCRYHKNKSWQIVAALFYFYSRTWSNIKPLNNLRNFCIIQTLNVNSFNEKEVISFIVSLIVETQREKR